MHYLLIYEVIDNYVEARAQFRTEHLQLAHEFYAAKKLVLGGALSDPVDQAVLLFDVDSPEEVSSFVDRDPYVQNGLVRRVQIRKWNTVVGDNASCKVT